MDTERYVQPSSSRGRIKFTELKLNVPVCFGKSERMTRHFPPSGLLICFTLINFNYCKTFNFTFSLLLLIHFSHFCFVLFWNVGQSYEIRMLNRKLVDYTDISSKYVKVGGRHCHFALYLFCLFFPLFPAFKLMRSPKLPLLVCCSFTRTFTKTHTVFLRFIVQQTTLFESCHFRLITPDKIPLISALTWEWAQTISSNVP